MLGLVAAEQVLGRVLERLSAIQITGVEVTLGGVATDKLSSRTMESQLRPGLYLIGEVVDVTGWLGGYNFQWAWSSGHAAGSAIAAGGS